MELNIPELQGYTEDLKTKAHFERQGLFTLPILIFFFVSLISGIEHWYDLRVCFIVAAVCTVVLIATLIVVNIIMPVSCISGCKMRRIIHQADNGVFEAIYICDESKTYFRRVMATVTYRGPSLR